MRRSLVWSLLTLACGPAAQHPTPEPTAVTPLRPSPYSDPILSPRRYLGRANVEMYGMPVDPPCARMPVGDPSGDGARLTQIFQSDKHHLGEDWVRSEGSSRGEPVFAMAPGFVIDAYDHGSEGCWGQVIRIAHRLADGDDDLTWHESLYAHLETIEVELGQRVELGARIGTIGDASCYGPHLHWEVRDIMNMPIGHGYSRDTRGYVEPSALVEAMRCPLSPRPPPSAENPG